MIQPAQRQTGERAVPATDSQLGAMLKHDAADCSLPSAELRDCILRQTVGSSTARAVKFADTVSHPVNRWPIGRLALAAGLLLAALPAAVVVRNWVSSPALKPPVPVVNQPTITPLPPVAASPDLALVDPLAMLDAPGEWVADLTSRLARDRMAGLVRHAQVHGEDWLNALPLPVELIADEQTENPTSP